MSANMSTNASNFTEDQVSSATFGVHKDTSGTRVWVVCYVPKIGNPSKQEKTTLYIATNAAYKIGFVLKNDTKMKDITTGYEVWIHLDCKKNMRAKQDLEEAPYLEVPSSEDGSKNLYFYHSDKYDDFLADILPKAPKPTYRRGDAYRHQHTHHKDDTDVFMAWCPRGIKCKDIFCEGNHHGRKACRNQFDTDGNLTQTCCFAGKLADGRKSACMHNHRKDNRIMVPNGRLPKQVAVPNKMLSHKMPSEKPTVKPTKKPVEKPTEESTVKPTKKPVEKPTEESTVKPTKKPVEKPTEEPAVKPTEYQSDREMLESELKEYYKYLFEDEPYYNGDDFPELSTK
jgi:hypothetical protein